MLRNMYILFCSHRQISIVAIEGLVFDDVNNDNDNDGVDDDDDDGGGSGDSDNDGNKRNGIITLAIAATLTLTIAYKFQINDRTLRLGSQFRPCHHIKNVSCSTSIIQRDTSMQPGVV